MRSSATGAALHAEGLLTVEGGKDISGHALASTELYGFATVKTDASDYPPGTTVNITGAGWKPNEYVQLTLVESPLVDTHGPYKDPRVCAGIINFGRVCRASATRHTSYHQHVPILQQYRAMITAS